MHIIAFNLQKETAFAPKGSLSAVISRNKQKRFIDAKRVPIFPRVIFIH